MPDARRQGGFIADERRLQGGGRSYSRLVSWRLCCTAFSVNAVPVDGKVGAEHTRLVGTGSANKSHRCGRDHFHLVSADSTERRVLIHFFMMACAGSL
jgi:hypothetical protein